MTTHTRRQILTTVGSLLSGTVLSSRRVAGQSSTPVRQYIIDSSAHSVQTLQRAGLRVIKELEPLELAVVQGTESTVRAITTEYVSDLPIERREATHLPRVSANSLARDDVDGSWYPVQWNKHVQNIQAVHDITRGNGVKVAIIDSGIQVDHSDFSHGAVNRTESRDFTGDGYGVGKAYGGDHGTAVASLVAGNGSYIVGSAPAAELVDCRVFSLANTAEGEPTVSTSTYLEAIQYAAEIGCDVANLSLGPGVTTAVRAQMLDILTATNTIAYARERDLLIVTAAGNESVDLHRYPLYNFTAEPNVMTISATGPLGFGWPITDSNGDEDFTDPSELETPIELQAPYHEFAPYSNYGTDVIDMSAPGGNYISAAPDSPGSFLDQSPMSHVEVTVDESGVRTDPAGIIWYNGTSFASPEVAGAAALLKSVDPSLSAAELRTTLKNGAANVGRKNPDPLHGAGFLDPLAALRSV